MTYTRPLSRLLSLGLILAASAHAQGAFDWHQAAGSTITVALNEHPYEAALLKKLPEFERLTGITVKYTVTNEEKYFDVVTQALSDKSQAPLDVFMTGIYQSWDYARKGQIEALDSYIKDGNKTAADYSFGDFFPGVINAGRWNLRAGSATGSGSQWVLPLGFESNTLAYNKKYFDAHGLKPPKTIDELVALAKKLRGWNGPGSYGIAVRGTKSWATIHPGYMSAFSTSGAKDFESKNGQLVSGLASKAAIDFTTKWATMIREGGPPNWETYTWYQSGADLAAGKAAMMFDADIVAFTMNLPGKGPESGHIGFSTPPTVKAGQKPSANEWIWGISMNKASRQKTAAWLFMQYFTSPAYQSWAATSQGVVNPPRSSIWKDPAFIASLKPASGYYDSFFKYIGNTSIKFTPQPFFFQTTTDWADALQRIVLKKADPAYTMTQLALDINRRYKIQVK